MRKLIEFQTSSNDLSALLSRSKPSTYDDLILTDAYRKYRHRFELGKTKIRLLPAMVGGSNWLLEIPSLQHLNGRHTHPCAFNAEAQSVYDLTFVYMKKNHPNRLLSRTNMSGVRLLPLPVSLCWAIVEDGNGVRLRLLLNSSYDGKRGGSNGLGSTIFNQVLHSGEKCSLPGHPLNRLDGTSLLVERMGGSDTKFPSYRVSLADERSPLQPLLEKITEMEHNALCPLEETIRVLEPEEEWRLLTKVVGHEIVSKIRSAQENSEVIESHEHNHVIEKPTRSDESSVGEALPADEVAYHPDDFKDFPAKWEI